MAYPTHYIGAYQVRNWIGSPPKSIQQSVEVIQYPGSDYEAIRTTGQRSGVFQMRSVVDCVSISAARTQLSNYQAFVGGDAVQLIWNSLDFDTLDLRVAVLRADLVSIERKIIICGSLTPGNTIDLTVDWSLLLVPH